MLIYKTKSDIGKISEILSPINRVQISVKIGEITGRREVWKGDKTEQVTNNIT